MSIVPIDATTSTAPVLAGPVTLRDELELWESAFEFARAIAGTALVPTAFRNNPPAVMACIIKGHELGVPALHALSQIHVIEGRPCMAAELQRALILSKGHELWTEDHTITRVVLCGRRRGAEHVQKVTWTTDDAKRANLAGKQNWRQYPRAMLLARASGELARIMFADVLAGMSYNLEELQDGVGDWLEALEPGTAVGELAPAPRTTRRTRKTAATAHRPAAAAPGPPVPASTSPEPGDPPPPLPGEDGYDTAPQRPQDDPPAPPSTPEPERPGDAHGALPPDEPAEVVTKRAQAIAMRARDVAVDHHHVVAAVTHGLTSSAKDLTAPEAGAVLQVLVDMKAGRARLAADDEGGWQIVAVAEPPLDPDVPEAPGEGESRVDEYQRRVRNLRSQQAEQRAGGQQTLGDDTGGTT